MQYLAGFGRQRLAHIKQAAELIFGQTGLRKRLFDGSFKAFQRFGCVGLPVCASGNIHTDRLPVALDDQYLVSREIACCVIAKLANPDMFHLPSTV
jgi:hypothetical protein